ncbi:hypothetical protein GCM10009123_15110 [Kangiella japonica]|uniref:Outer membrane lipoprotein carrier protein LolA n=1 Tax=Kangiella japonica TaxID=647384 RepID=A0ABN0T0Q8_9GAMM
MIQRIITLTILTSTLLFVFGSQSVSAFTGDSCDLKQITQVLQSQESLHQFSQEKHIKVLANPLKSSGYLLLADNDAVVWQTLKPIKSTTVISELEFKQFNKNDQPVSMPTNSDNQTSQLISSTFLSILSGNLNSLNANFEVEALCDQSSWDIRLTPTNPRIKRMIKLIQIDGSGHIEHLSFSEANDDTTKLLFTPVSEPLIKKQLGSYLVD